MAEKDNKQLGAKPQDQKHDKPVQKRPQMPTAGKPVVSASGKEVKGVVRLAGRDLRGSLPIGRAITSVRGVGINLGAVLSREAYQQLGISDKTMVGELSEEEVGKLEQILQHPQDHGVPVRMFNRQKDLISGNDMHLIGSDLAFTVKQDIEHEKDANTWKGYRHTYGQKVRGQRTRSTGRTGMTVGVLRKAVLAKAGAAAAAQTGAAAQAAGAVPAAATPGAKGAPAPKAGAAAPAAKAAAPAAAPKAAAPAKKEEKK